MNEEVQKHLWKRLQSSRCDLVFDIKGRKILSSLLTHKFKRWVRKANLDDRIHFHSLRHTFATWLVQDGVNIYDIQKLLGHSSVKVTEVYSHLLSAELRSIVGRIKLPALN